MASPKAILQATFWTLLLVHHTGSSTILPVYHTETSTILPVYHTGPLALVPVPLRTFTLEELIPQRAELYPERLTPQWISGTEYIFREPGLGIQKHNVVFDTITSFLREEDLVDLGGRTLSDLSQDGKYMLLTANRRKVYRYSSMAEYSVYDLEKKTHSRIGEEPLQVVLWGPGRSLAFVKRNNVYYMPDVTLGTVRTLTTEGIPGEVYFGVTDWIYEEEVFNAPGALWFSPGGTYLAVASFNDTKVPTASYPIYGNPADLNSQYPQTVVFKYPKAGRTNPIPGLRVFELTDPNSTPRIIPAPVEVVSEDHILGRVNWISDSNLAVLWLNRRQNVSILINCNMETVQCQLVKEQLEPSGWIDINSVNFDSTGSKVIELTPFYYNDKRYMHIGLFDLSTLRTEELAPGNSTVAEVLGWNEETDTVYYRLIPAHMPWQRQVWASVKGQTRCISCKEPSCRSANAQFAPGAAYGIVTCSSMNEPPNIFLYNGKDDTFKLLKDNSRLKARLSHYRMPMSLYNLLNFNEVQSVVKLQLPSELIPGIQYPMIVRVYAGPGSSRVTDTFELDYATYLATNRSIIVASIDVRGSSALGMDAMHAVNNALGTVEVSDTLAVIRRLVEIYPFIDPARVGVWGWSYGGFTSTMMLINDKQKTLACGAAVAPVTSWLYYDSIYTERYMDTPQNNPRGYSQADLMLHAEGLRGRKFLLIHGTGDDNVHYQNSLQLAKRLQQKDIEFEQMSYTDESHSLHGVSRHFYHTLDHFWTECFA